MNRHYTTAAYLEKCRLIREYFPLAAITTDVIAGFPGETEEEFCETLAFIREAAFSRIHAFPYSKREGTEAASMDGQLTERVKKERCRELIALGEELAGEFAAKFIGRRVEVLIEETGPGGLPEGYTREYLRACVKSVDPTIPGEKGAVEANTLVSGTVEGVDRYGRLVLALGEC